MAQGNYSEKEKPRDMPIMLKLAWVQHYYPNIYRAEHYPTTDKVIPYKLFFLYYAASTANTALDRLNTGLAVMYGKAMLDNQNRSHVTKMMNALHDEAHGIFQ